MARGSMLIALTALLVGLGTGGVVGRQSANDEVRRLHEIYYGYFAEGNAKRIAEEIYHPNRLQFGSSGVAVSSSAEEVETSFAQATESRSPQGYDRSELPEPVICSPNPGTAIISGRIERYHTDGSVMAEMGSTYIYGKTPDGWRIHATISHGPDTAIGCVSP